MTGAPKLSGTEFRRFAEIFEAEAGLHFNAAKRELLAARLGKRMRALGVDSFSEYLERAGDDEELRRMLDHVTTNQTYFWREPEHFVHLAAWLRALPPDAGAPVRIWCAASSSGEEAYTLAMCALDALEGKRDVRVLGSDISERMLDRAVAATYDEARLAELPGGWKLRWMEHVGGGRWRVKDELRRKVSFARLNLMELPEAPRGLDAIFCRNVMIYFDRSAQTKVVEALERRLRPGGWLYTGMAESLLAISHGLLNRAPSVYQRPA